MASNRHSPIVLKYLFGQHVLNGLAVSGGVGLTAVLMSLLLGAPAGMTAATGAMCISIGDQPNSVTGKAVMLPLGLVLGVLSSAAVAFTAGHPPFQGAALVLLSFLAGLVVGYGRWAFPLSILILLSLVLTLGAPLHDLDGALAYESRFAAGGLTYVLLALSVTWGLDASNRRLAIGETLREFAAYLRGFADFYDQMIDPAAAYGRLIERQSSLSDHLQAARRIVFSGRRKDNRLCLAGALSVQLDALDALISAHIDQKVLRDELDAAELAAAAAGLARQLAADLERLAIDLLTGQRRLKLPDRSPSLDALSGLVAALSARTDVDPALLRAARATRTRLAWVTGHLARLPGVLAAPEQAQAALAGVDLDAFMPTQSLNPAPLKRHLRLGSPIFRHGLRLSAAMGTGYALTVFVPALHHGNWILVTIAVVLRANYSATRQRRNDRLLGNLLGCLITALLLKFADTPALLAALFVAIGLAHAFSRVQYVITATTACVMALLALHFLDPVNAPPVLSRLIDTAIGVVICSLFSHLLPRWEAQDTPRLIIQLLRTMRSYAATSLKLAAGEQSYRLARKAVIEALAALTESAGRMKGEPTAVRRDPDRLARLLAAAYVMAAQIVTVRLLAANRRHEIDPEAGSALLASTLAEVEAVLEPGKPLGDRPKAPSHAEEAGLGALQALAMRCDQLCHQALILRKEIGGFLRNKAV